MTAWPRTSRSRKFRRRRSGVSIVEVLAVMAILILLLAMLLPSLFQARQQARRVFCANNLRQWGLALEYYREDHADHIPMEGTSLGSNPVTGRGLFQRGTWYNELPFYLDMSAYREIEGANVSIREMKNGHVWICPAKERSEVAKSSTGKNQFHYGMNQILDGMGTPPAGSNDTPGYPDPKEAAPIPARKFHRHSQTAILFDILPNSPAGSPRDAATEYARGFNGEFLGKFHGDYVNILLLDGKVGGFRTGDLVTNNDLRHGKIIWDHPGLYWGYPPPRP